MQPVIKIKGRSLFHRDDMVWGITPSSLSCVFVYIGLCVSEISWAAWVGFCSRRHASPCHVHFPCPCWSATPCTWIPSCYWLRPSSSDLHLIISSLPLIFTYPAKVCVVCQIVPVFILCLSSVFLILFSVFFNFFSLLSFFGIVCLIGFLDLTCAGIWDCSFMFLIICQFFWSFIESISPCLTYGFFH